MFKLGFIWSYACYEAMNRFRSGRCHFGGNVPSSGPGDDEVHEVVIHKNRVSLDLS
jgi:hypothetical protein